MKKLILALIVFAALTALTASVTVLERSPDHLLVEYRLDDFTLTEAGEYIRLDAAGMATPALSGSPLLPFGETKIGIPPAGGISASVLSSVKHSERLAKRLMPVPEILLNGEVSEFRYQIDESLYRTGESDLLRPLEATSYRGFGFVPIEIHPFAYDGHYGLEITEQALIRIQITGNTAFRGSSEPDELSQMMLEKLLNPSQSLAWQNITRDPVEYADFSRSDFWLRLETDRDGMFKLSPSQLTGFPVGDLDPRSFRLFSTGGLLLPFTITQAGTAFQEVPIRVVGEADGSFDPADYIVFYGTTRDGEGKNQSLQSDPPYFNPYSGNTVYWLTAGGEFGSPPLRMPTQPALQAWDNTTSRFNQKTRLETESQRRLVEGFDWFMTRMFGNTTAEYQFQIDLEDVDTSLPQNLSMFIQQEDAAGGTSHNISVYVNDVPVPADTNGSIIFQWSGTGKYIFNQPVSSFVTGTNNIRIKVLRTSTDNLFLNWIAADYTRYILKTSAQLIVNQLLLNYGVPVRYNLAGNSVNQVYRVNSFTDVEIVPLQTEGFYTYFVSSGEAGTRFVLSADSELLTPVNVAFHEPVNLASSTQAIDNVVITADEFSDQAQSLADMYWQDLGKRSLVVKQSDIFNQFNGGHPDPVAIRQFLRHAWQNYPTPRLTSVTLIGLGTLDWRNFSGQAAAKNKIIVFQRGERTSDDYFVLLSQSAYPELEIGRYPVSNATELNNMLANFQDYNQNPQPGWWRNSMVFLGDDLYNGSDPYYEPDHTQQTETSGYYVHPSVLVDKIFAWEYEYDEFQNKPAARDDMLNAVNEGRLLWYYIGHGAYDKLGSEDYFNGASDMGRFNNPGKLPFFIAASCKVSQFDYWGFESLGQKVVLLNDLGAIGSLAATRLSNGSYNTTMINYLLQSLSHGRNHIGYAINSAKLQFTTNDNNDAVYVLLGDPLLRIVPPLRDSVMAFDSADPQAKEDTAHARQLVSISGSFDPSNYSGTAEIRAYNSKTSYNLDANTPVSHRGAQIFKGIATVSGGQYSSGFIVPDDIATGNSGLIVSYIWDPAAKQDYVNYYHPLSLNDQAVTAENPDSPEIELYLGSMDFRPGDTVGTNPTLYARIADSNGINVTGSAGHNILLILDDSLQPLPVTEYFTYDLDSHTNGLLTYSLSGLAEGPHTLQVIAFDNFNLPSVATTNFVVRQTGDLSIERFLIYPNPMESSTSFTFMLSQDSDLTVDIFTLSGRKVHSFKALGKQGFNAVPWNGRDSRGDRLANNTYFVKLRASAEGKKTEKIEKLVIYN